METISRAAAKDAGLKTYFTGTPCARGHLEVRSVSNGICFQCRRDSSNAHRAKNVEADRAKSRKWYAENKTRATQWKREWVANNTEKYKERRRRYRSQLDTRAREMFTASKWSAKKKGLPFDLDIGWIRAHLERGTCELTELPYRLEPLDGGRQNPYTASLDRITPENGYVKSNVRVILWALNAAFNTYGADVYADIAKVYLARHHGTGIT